jgi:hypothetical protein
VEIDQGWLSHPGGSTVAMYAFVPTCYPVILLPTRTLDRHRPGGVQLIWRYGSDNPTLQGSTVQKYGDEITRFVWPEANSVYVVPENVVCGKLLSGLSLQITPLAVFG